jgi:hypothetical protein
MITISGHRVNPQHVSAVHVVQPKTREEKKHWRQHEIEIVLISGYKFLDWGRGTDDINEAEASARSLSSYIQSAAQEELVAAAVATTKAAMKLAGE